MDLQKIIAVKALTAAKATIRKKVCIFQGMTSVTGKISGSSPSLAESHAAIKSENMHGTRADI